MSEWQPIETAPKDTYVLLWCDEASDVPMVGYFGNRWELAHADGDPFMPTHWMPLPEPPK